MEGVGRGVEVERSITGGGDGEGSLKGRKLERERKRLWGDIDIQIPWHALGEMGRTRRGYSEL